MSGKRYTEEFKKETVKQILEQGYTVNSLINFADWMASLILLSISVEK